MYLTLLLAFTYFLMAWRLRWWTKVSMCLRYKELQFQVLQARCAFAEKVSLPAAISFFELREEFRQHTEQALKQMRCIALWLWVMSTSTHWSATTNHKPPRRIEDALTLRIASLIISGGNELASVPESIQRVHAIIRRCCGG